MRVASDRLARASVLVLAAALSTGCYQTHRIGGDGAIPPVDGGPSDARDAFVAPPDAFVFDVGTDAFTPGPRCDRDVDCFRSFCVLDTSVPPVDLAQVSLRCGEAGSTPPGSECEENAECRNGLCALAGGCVAPCLTDADCGSDERCGDVPIVTSRSSLQRATACTRWTDVPPGVVVTESTSLPVSPFSSQTFSVPGATHPRRLVHHIADRYEAFRSIDRITLSGPGGALLHDIGSMTRMQVNPAVAFFDLVPILVPNAPWPAGLDTRGPLGYAITTGGESTLRRIVMEHDGLGTTLDLNVFFVGISRDPRARRTVENLLANYDVLLSSLGLRLGRVRERVVVGDTTDGFAVVDDEVEAGELFLLSNGAARPAVNLFLVPTSPLFLGLAGGIPGGMGIHGTRSSGIVLSFDDLQGALDVGFPERFLAVVLAHEVGHFLGLFHSSEGDGTSWEPLSDTPRCDIAHDANADGLVTAEECLDRDGANVMFWAVSEPDATFSPMQQDVLRGAPVLLP